MRQRLTIILTFVVIIGLLVIINAVSHVQEEQERDLEMFANRSTYNSGPTGTRALHDFLSESGYKVMRWREPLAEIMSTSRISVATLVIVGETRLPFDQQDFTLLRAWVGRGGRLVVIDRTPDMRLMSNPGWAVTPIEGQLPDLDTNPGDVNQMTQTVTEFRPIQPTLLTTNVDSVMPSRFASRFVIAAERKPDIASGETIIDPGGVVSSMPSPSPDAVYDEDDFWGSSLPEETATPPPPEAVSAEDADEDSDEDDTHSANPAPIAHIADAGGALVVDYALGNGRVVLVGDPYLISNGGVVLKDNLALAINVLGGPRNQGLIAFDEYHQGHGISRNAFASYFAGTSVLPIAGQLVLLVLVVLWTNGRRFARPLPLTHVDRRSSLEFVASMAELQERSRAYDLAIENIYTRTRRVLARHAGIDYNSSRSEIAQRIADRSTIDRNELEGLMRECEEAINGEPINSRETISLVRRLRQIERDLGLRLRSREARQAAENI
jgi:hypothetical protein